MDLVLDYLRVGFRTGKAEHFAQGPKQPLGLHICLVTLYCWVFYGRVGLHSSTTEVWPGASTCQNPALYDLMMEVCNSELMVKVYSTLLHHLSITCISFQNNKKKNVFTLKERVLEP